MSYICPDDINVTLYYAKICKMKSNANFNTDVFPKSFSVVIVMIDINKVATTTNTNE